MVIKTIINDYEARADVFEFVRAFDFSFYSNLNNNISSCYPEHLKNKILVTKCKHPIHDIETSNFFHYGGLIFDKNDLNYFLLTVPEKDYDLLYDLDECLYKLLKSRGLVK